MSTSTATRQKIVLLSSLYFAQGLPYGFFTQALPFIMRVEGMDLSVIGVVTSALALPWALKMLWAPLVDRYQGSPLGARRGFIIPLQLSSVLLVAGMALFNGASNAVTLLAAAVALTNVLAASQDIATDALAVKLLRAKEERGLGNGIQVAGYRMGMVVGSGFLVASFQLFGWAATFAIMAGLLLLSSIPVMLLREPPNDDDGQRTSSPTPWHSMVAYLRAPGVWMWLLLLMLYKIGDGMGSPMVRLMMQDAGASMAQIGLWTGSVGSAVALAGALVGGWYAGQHRVRALAVAGFAHALLMVGYATGMHEWTWALLVLEHFTGSMATVALFTVMMDATHTQQAGVQYTVQASVVVWASGIGAALSGVSADALGYTWHFIVAGALCVLGTWAMVVGRRHVGVLVPEQDTRLTSVGSSAAAPAS
jgi:MFS transporter, PAT family, beta-lactamase induction signal transducer AmpG